MVYFENFEIKIKLESLTLNRIRENQKFREYILPFSSFCLLQPYQLGILGYGTVFQQNRQK